MLKRVPEGKKRFEEKAPKVLDEVRIVINEKFNNLIETDPSHVKILEKRKEEAQNIFKKFRENLPEKVWHLVIEPHMTPKILTAICSMTWQFLTCEKPNAFLTSDNPVFHFESLGIGNPDSEVTFPISSNIALLATWRNDLTEGFYHTDNNIIKEINRRTAYNASRYIYYFKKASWVTLLANKSRHQMNRIKYN